MTPDRGRSRTAGWETLNSFVDNEISQLAPPAACVWLVLFRHARRSDGVVTRRLSTRRLAEMTRLDRKTILRSVDHLLKRGLLSVAVAATKRSPPVYRVRHSNQSVVPLVPLSEVEERDHHTEVVQGPRLLAFRPAG
jgi:hypothetical protein